MARKKKRAWWLDDDPYSDRFYKYRKNNEKATKNQRNNQIIEKNERINGKKTFFSYIYKYIK